MTDVEDRTSRILTKAEGKSRIGEMGTPRSVRMVLKAAGIRAASRLLEIIDGPEFEELGVAEQLKVIDFAFRKGLPDLGRDAVPEHPTVQVGLDFNAVLAGAKFPEREGENSDRAKRDLSAVSAKMLANSEDTVPKPVTYLDVRDDPTNPDYEDWRAQKMLAENGYPSRYVIGDPEYATTPKSAS